MGLATYCVALRNGSPAPVKVQDASMLNLQLTPDLVWRIAIDQSSKETGIYAIDAEGTQHVIINIARRAQEKERYYEELKFFLKRMVRGVKVEFFVREALPPIQNAKGNYSTPVLQSLIGRINAWRSPDIIPEFAAIEDKYWTSIMPGTWKKHMNDKSKGKNRVNKKREMALDILDRFPEFIHYFNYQNPSSDYDGFDACGILHGYLAERGNGTFERIVSAKEYRGDIYVFYRALSKQEATNRDSLLRGFEVQEHKFGVEALNMNPGGNLYDNVKMAATKFNFVLSAVSNETEELMLRIMFDMGLDDRTIYVYIVRKSAMGVAQLRDLKAHYPFECVTW
jgi:hypothetical protein